MSEAENVPRSVYDKRKANLITNTPVQPRVPPQNMNSLIPTADSMSQVNYETTHFLKGKAVEQGVTRSEIVLIE